MENAEDPRVLQAVFVNTKRIGSRKAYQVILEVPEENQKLVHDALGYANSSGSIWVAVARLNNCAEQQKDQPEEKAHDAA